MAEQEEIVTVFKAKYKEDELRNLKERYKEIGDILDKIAVGEETNEGKRAQRYRIERRRLREQISELKGIIALSAKADVERQAAGERLYLVRMSNRAMRRRRLREDDELLSKSIDSSFKKMEKEDAAKAASDKREAERSRREADRLARESRKADERLRREAARERIRISNNESREERARIIENGKISRALMKEDYRIQRMELAQIHRQEKEARRAPTGSGGTSVFGARLNRSTGPDYFTFGARQLVSEYLGLIGVTNAASYVKDKFVDYDRMATGLKVTEGSNWKNQFDWMQKFAMASPLDLKQTIEAYNMMKVLGVTANEQLMTNLGNVATANNTDVFSLVDAINSMKAGMSNPLEHGFKVSVAYHRDKKSGHEGQYGITSIGADGKPVTSYFKKDENIAKNLISYFSKMGETRYAGAQDRYTHTLIGRTNQLLESIDSEIYNIKNAGEGNRIADSIGKLTDFIKNGNARRAVSGFVNAGATAIETGVDLLSTPGVAGTALGIAKIYAMSSALKLLAMSLPASFNAAITSVGSFKMAMTGAMSFIGRTGALFLVSEFIDTINGKRSLFNPTGFDKNSFSSGPIAFSTNKITSLGESSSDAQKYILSRSVNDSGPIGRGFAWINDMIFNADQNAKFASMGMSVGVGDTSHIASTGFNILEILSKAIFGVGSDGNTESFGFGEKYYNAAVNYANAHKNSPSYPQMSRMIAEYTNSINGNTSWTKPSFFQNVVYGIDNPSSVLGQNWSAPSIVGPTVNLNGVRIGEIISQVTRTLDSFKSDVIDQLNEHLEAGAGNMSIDPLMSTQ